MGQIQNIFGKKKFPPGIPPTPSSSFCGGGGAGWSPSQPAPPPFWGGRAGRAPSQHPL